MSRVIIGLVISSMALDAIDAPGHDWVPKYRASLLLVASNSAASLVDPKVKRTFVRPTVGAE